MAIRALLSLRDAKVETKRRNDLASYIKMTMSAFNVLNFIKQKQKKVQLSKANCQLEN